MCERNYKYIILGSGLGHYYDYAYRQVNDIEGCLYDGAFPWNTMIQKINRVHYSNKLNKYIKLPFKKIWIFAYLRYIDRKVKSVAGRNEKICFIFFRTWFLVGLLDNGFAEILKKAYPNCKIVFFLQDQVRVSGISIDLLKESADLMIYYDKCDAAKWGGRQHDVPYSRIDDFKVSEDEIESDVYFCGYAKDRYDQIIKFYEVLTSRGLLCDFHIIGVAKEKRLYEDKINFEKVLTYEENLNKVARTRCVLEIIQRESEGNTLRVYEAIMLDKLLLSNNEALVKSTLYNEKFMSVCIKPEYVNSEWIKNSKDVHYEGKEALYPDKLLDFIEKC